MRERLCYSHPRVQAEGLSAQHGQIGSPGPSCSGRLCNMEPLLWRLQSAGLNNGPSRQWGQHSPRSCRHGSPSEPEPRHYH